MIEALPATPATAKRYEDADKTFVELTRQVLPKDERLPDTIAEIAGRRRCLDRPPADPTAARPSAPKTCCPS